VPAFWVKLGAIDLNCVDVPLNPTHSLTAVFQGFCMLSNSLTMASGTIKQQRSS